MYAPRQESGIIIHRNKDSTTVCMIHFVDFSIHSMHAIIFIFFQVVSTTCGVAVLLMFSALHWRRHFYWETWPINNIIEPRPLAGCVGQPGNAPEPDPAQSRSRGVISRASCRSNVTAQLGLAARMFCCLASGDPGERDTRISWVKMEDLSIISHHNTIFSTDKRMSVMYANLCWKILLLVQIPSFYFKSKWVSCCQTCSDHSDSLNELSPFYKRIKLEQANKFRL